jgi:hypothetical protein
MKRKYKPGERVKKEEESESGMNPFIKLINGAKGSFNG